MTLVLDASVIIKWLFADRADEAHSIRALEILELIKSSEVSVVEPPHWFAEVSAVSARLDPSRARRAVSLLYAMELPIATELEVYQKACNLSISLSQHVFDTLYHSVALLETDAMLVTADERYYRAARQLGRITLLKNFVPQQWHGPGKPKYALRVRQPLEFVCRPL